MPAKSLKSIGLSDLLGIYLLAVLVFFGETLAGDPGLGWHLRTGQWILEHLRIPAADPFLASAGHARWICNQWLGDVILWLCYRAGGFALLHAFAAGLCIAVYVFALGPLLKHEVRSPLSVFLALFLCALLGKIQWFIRPVLFSFVLAALVYRAVYILYQAAAGCGMTNHRRRVFYGLPVLFALWANLHPAFSVGLGIILIAAIAAGLDGVFLRRENQAELLRSAQRLFCLFVLCSGATLLNPYGWSLHHEIWSLLGSSYFMTLNREWFPPEWRNQAFWPFGFAGAAFVGLFAFCGRGALTIFEIISAAVFFVMSLLQRRYIPFFGIAAALPFAKLIARSSLTSKTAPAGSRTRLLCMLRRADSGLAALPARASAWGYSFCFWLVIAAYGACFSRLPFRSAEDSGFSRSFPHDAVQKMRENEAGTQGAVFNHPDWGGYDLDFLSVAACFYRRS
ncbi:MAG TPA: hypothetical protein PLP17_00250 [Oligoflexia bacterium]|nr:hypothetical protein [Oligoflexia bacterium]